MDTTLTQKRMREEVAAISTKTNAQGEPEACSGHVPAALASAQAHGQVVVDHIKSPSRTGFADVRVDRQSVLGNPFPMGHNGRDEALRDRVCVAFEDLIQCSTPATVIAQRHNLGVDRR